MLRHAEERRWIKFRRFMDEKKGANGALLPFRHLKPSSPPRQRTRLGQLHPQ